jgi:hypothetical protein
LNGAGGITVAERARVKGGRRSAEDPCPPSGKA